ncbi:MAG: polysaccharide deacetylase family protein [Vicingaceae bacterium]|nr:polysaccharide deacetylase family protein [Vicingaceae bacterium]
MILPFYHVVTNEESEHFNQLYPIKTVEEFKSDLDFLLKHFKPISLDELIELNKSGKRPKKNCFHLTFDDGLKELYTIVAPILKEKKIPATFFINTDFIDNQQLFYRFKANLLAEKYAATGMLDLPYGEEKTMDMLAETLDFSFNDYLANEQPYLTTSQINELVNDGFTIGGHSINHPLYKDITEEEQIRQTLESVNILVDKFKLNYKVFSFPFTDDGIKKDFYMNVNPLLDLTFGTAGLKTDLTPKNLQRIPMEENRKGIEIIKSQYLYYVLKKLIGKNTIKR